MPSFIPHRRARLGWRCLATAVLAAAASNGLAQSSYGVTELKPFFLGSTARGLALSPTGTVVGFANVLIGYKFEMYSGMVGDYAMSGVQWPWNSSSTQAPLRFRPNFTAFDINASGAMLISSDALWINGQSTPLSGKTESLELRPMAMNASNDVVGAVSNGTGLQPVWWQSSGTVLQRLPVPAQSVSGWATDINDKGQIVGVVVDANKVSFAVRWTGGQVDWVGQPYTDAKAINNDGWFLLSTSGPVVVNTGPPVRHALVKIDGTEVPLVDSSGATIRADDLNNRGDVVGSLSYGHVIVRKQDGRIIDLKALHTAGKIKLPKGLTLSSCDHINDQGVLVCSTDGKGSTLRSFRLRPL